MTKILHTHFFRTALFAFIFTLWALSQTIAADSRTVFADANQAYRNGEFQKAYEGYMHLVKSGEYSGTIFYNLGNACAKMNRKGEAVLWFERAKLLIPGDKDLNDNLKKLTPTAPGGFLARQKNTLLSLFTVSEALIFGTLLLSLTGLFGFTFFLSGKRKTVGVLFKYLACFSVITTPIVALKLMDAGEPKGIILTHNTIVRSGPGNNFEELTRLPEGEKYTLLNFNDSAWFHIALSDGQKGFIQKNQANNIYPIPNL